MLFTVFDIILLVIVLIICIRAAAKGLIDEVFGLGTFILGAYLAFYFMPKLKPYLAACMNETLAAILSFLLLFIIVFLVMKIIQLALKSVFSGSILKSLDHGLGFLFGIAEGLFMIVIIFILLSALQTWIDTEALRNESFIYKTLNGLIDSASSQVLEHI